jgi:hypothetical protein
MSQRGTTGADVARSYFEEVVQPLMAAHFEGLPYATGRLGPGSDVLGLDDATSRDHDWGLRLSLFVAAEAVPAVDAELERRLPISFLDMPTRFPFTGETSARHRVEVTSVPSFVQGRLGFDPRRGPSASVWLSLSGQAVLEVTAGPVFVDDLGDLSEIRQALAWYPEDLWRYVLACDWARISQELPLMGRAGDVGDEIGARIIAARVAQSVMHLTYLLARRWPPYAKWFGTVFNTLPNAATVAPAVDRLLDGRSSADRQRAVTVALDGLLQQQNGLGLTAVTSATVPFWDRPHLRVHPAVVQQLLAPVSDPEVRALPLGRGSIEQRTDNVDLLVDPAARRAALGCSSG